MNKPQIIAELEEITGLAEQTDNTYLYNKTKRTIDSLKEIWSMEEFYLLEMQKNIMQ